MRLICPECAAQYEIADGLIPADGRDVECSSCGHGWRQSGLPPLRLSPDVAVARDGASPADTPPRVSRGLTDPVLAILREEAERELSARAAARAGQADPLADAPAEDVGGEVPQDDLAARPSAHPDVPAGDGLPDPHALAASLEWQVPARQAPEVIPPQLPAPVPPPRLPALTKAQAEVIARQRSHNRGFAVAILLAAVLAGAYAAAPSLAERGGAGGPIMDARASADRGRAWLQSRAETLTDGAIARLKALFD